MTPDQTTRVGDHERELVSSELRAHFTSGRLGMDDFSSRLDQTWSAQTMADLITAVRDLPPVPGHPRPWDGPGTVPGGNPYRSSMPSPAPAPRPAAPCPPAWPSRWAHHHTHTYFKVACVLVIIWALSGFGYFWPIWPLAIWGFFVWRHEAWARRRARDHWEW